MNRKEIGQILKALQDSSERAAASMAKFREAFVFHDNPTTPASPQDRALAARRNRNTGPADRVGLDGHHHRRMRR